MRRNCGGQRITDRIAGNPFTLGANSDRIAGNLPALEKKLPGLPAILLLSE